MKGRRVVSPRTGLASAGRRLADALKARVPWKSRRIGLSVGIDTIRAVVLRAGAIEWKTERTIDRTAALAPQIAAAVANAPSGWLRRTHVVAAVGPGHSQVKLLHGLPPVRDVSEASAIAREARERFFVGNGAPLVTTSAYFAADGTVWCAAIDEPTSEAIGAACSRRKLRLDAIVPSLSVLALAVRDGTILVEDGTIVAEVSIEQGKLSRVRRCSVSSAGPNGKAAAEAVPGLSAVGDRAIRFAEAYGAARADRNAPMALPPLSRARASRPVPRWRIGVSVAALALAIAAVAMAPGLAARQERGRAQRSLDGLGAPHGEAIRLQRDLAQVTAALEDAGGFASERGSPLELLAALTTALPEHSAIVTLRVDSVAGTMVILGPRVASVIPQLENVQSIVAPEVVGPVTREVVGGREIERATVRFRLARRSEVGS